MSTTSALIGTPRPTRKELTVETDWFQIFSEAIAKVDAGIYQHPLASRDRLIALACAEAVENRMPMHEWLTAQENSHRAKGITAPRPTHPGGH
jgi:hypothetical protein